MGGAAPQTCPHSRGKTGHQFCDRGIVTRFQHEMLPGRASANADAAGEKARPQNSALKISFRQRLPRAFVLPVDRQNPPAPSVVEQLNAVDPAHKRLRGTPIVTRIISAPDACDLGGVVDPAAAFSL